MSVLKLKMCPEDSYLEGKDGTTYKLKEFSPEVVIKAVRIAAEIYLSAGNQIPFPDLARNLKVDSMVTLVAKSRDLCKLILEASFPSWENIWDEVGMINLFPVLAFIFENNDVEQIFADFFALVGDLTNKLTENNEPEKEIPATPEKKTTK